MTSHGIMFHHFHGGSHPAGQGSLSASEFDEMLTFLQGSYSILPAHEYCERALSGRLRDSDTCLTFDDSLLCQYELAAPVLASRDMTGFFFVYSSAFSQSPDMLEVYRYFRSTEYPDIETFYAEFIYTSDQLYDGLASNRLAGFQAADYLVDCPFYTLNDRRFRYLRDRVLTSEMYARVMADMMATRGFTVEEVLPRLFMREGHLAALQEGEHVIGLHSHSHPLVFSDLDEREQQLEYRTNYDFIESVLGQGPSTMSHPMGRYNEATLRVLRSLGIEIGFRASLGGSQSSSLLEIPREDHANVITRMRA